MRRKNACSGRCDEHADAEAEAQPFSFVFENVLESNENKQWVQQVQLFL
jgi:hypothetical protein